MYTWTVKTGERYWSVWLDWEKNQNIYRHQLYILYMFLTSLEWRGLGRAPSLTFFSIPLGKATFKELVHRDFAASWYFAQSNVLSALLWWHMIGAVSMSLKTSYEAVNHMDPLKRDYLDDWNAIYWICPGRPRRTTILLVRINQLWTSPSLPRRLDANRLQCVTSDSPALVLTFSPWVLDAFPRSTCCLSRLEGLVGKVMDFYLPPKESFSSVLMEVQHRMETPSAVTSWPVVGSYVPAR